MFRFLELKVIEPQRDNFLSPAKPLRRSGEALTYFYFLGYLAYYYNKKVKGG
jgi:hypothetical protein